MKSDPSLIAELEVAIQSGSSDKRVDVLRRITDLFVADAGRFNSHQIDLFDDVLSHLIKTIEGKALAELSRRLAPINNAPVEVVRHLARNDDIAVAEPILTQSRRLSDCDLIDIANTKPQAHLRAIAARAQIGSKVTDVLLRRGDQHVFHRLAGNAGAGFSEKGFATLVEHAERNEQLAEKVGLRLDVPLPLFCKLLSHATEVVRNRLFALAGPETRDKIQRVLATISQGIQREANFQNESDYAEAHARMLALKSKRELNEAVLFERAKVDRYADVIAGLALMCGASMHLVDNLLQSDHREAWLIPCKAAGLDWPTVRVILSSRSVSRTFSDRALDTARAEYSKLSQSSAGRILRFWQVRQSAVKDIAQPSGSQSAPLAVGRPLIAQSRATD